MKKLLVALAAVLVTAATSYGQGQINFNNLGALTDSAKYGIFLPGGTTGPGGSYTAQLFLVGDSGVTPLTPATTFASDAGFEYLLQPVDITVPGVASGGTANFRVQVWDTLGGSFDGAKIARGQIDFSGKVGGGVNPPENTVFDGFNLVAVPEPSTIALGLIGAGALLLRRRK